jgi:integrase/recombinase XerD
MQQSLVTTEKTEEDFITLWIKQKRSNYTRTQYRRTITKFQVFLREHGVANVVQATVFDLQAFVDRMTEENLSHGSQKVAIDTIRAYLSYAQKTGFTHYNVGAAFAPLQKPETMHERILSEYEVQCMIMQEKDPRNHAILRILYGGGLRVAEMCGIKWSHLILRDGGCLQVTVTGKGNKLRHVLLSAEASKAVLAITRKDPDTFVFRNTAYHSTRLTPRAVQYIVKEAARRAGVHDWEHVSPHWLRHSHATHTIDRGAPLSLVRDTLGHSSIAVTDAYAHVRPGESSARFLPKF